MQKSIGIIFAMAIYSLIMLVGVQAITELYGKINEPSTVEIPADATPV